MSKTKKICRRLALLTLLVQIVALFCLMPAYATDSDTGFSEYEAAINNLIDFDMAKEMDDYYKALYAFNQLTNNCVYDYDTYNRTNVNLSSYTAYGAIVNGKAVCSGYARAYMDILDRMGVPCLYLSSSSMNHAWNQVQIDGNWYHVDPTWGIFLCSDDQIKLLDHYGWLFGHECSDTTYDEDPLMLNIYSQLGFLDENYMFYTAPANDVPRWLATTEMAVMRKNIQTEEVEILCEYEESNIFLGTGKTAPSGLFIDNGYIYFCDSHYVYRVCCISGEYSIIYEHDYQGEQTLLLTCKRDGDFLRLEVEDIDWERSEKIIDFPDTEHTYSTKQIAPSAKKVGYTEYTCSCGGTCVAESTEEYQPFVDVEKGIYYYEPVMWAADNGITLGTSATQFSPDKTCTRAEVVTFLWRAMGSPEPETSVCPFEDVKSDTYYYKAVLWATENGITKGTSNTTFSPGSIVTRSQFVTFLWRSAGEPATASENPFSDIERDYYYDAVLWAVETGITKGTSDTTFAPLKTCSRGETVTFLYRYEKAGH